MNILIVDDVATNRKLLSALLEDKGHRVFDAVDGVEALAILEREAVEAIISDILMPRMDGFRLCHEVRHDKRLRDLAFIFLTSSYTSPADEKLALDMGGDKFLTKPVAVEKITEALREAITAHRRPHPLREPAQELRLMREYNQRLIAKLEEKNAALTRRNGDLRLQGTALETAADGVVITDIRGNILWVNPAFCALTGYSSNEVIGQSPRILKSGRHDRTYYEELWTTLLSGNTWRGSFTNRRKDGTLYYDEHTVTPVRGEDGTLSHFVAIMHNVTDRKRAEAALSKSEGRFRLLVDHAVDAFFLHDAQGRFLDVNRQACESLGYTRSQLLALHLPDVVCSSPESLQAGLDRLQYGATSTATDELRRQDGSRFPVEIRVNAFEADGQKLYLGLARDITERVRAEEVVHDVSSQRAENRRKRAIRDLGIIAVLVVIVFWVGRHTETFDLAFHKLDQEDAGRGGIWNDAVGTLMFVCLGMVIFSYRRWKESEEDVLSQTQISQALAILNKEMDLKVQERTAQLVQTNDDLRREIDERRRVEAIIKQFPAIVESSNDAIISKTLNGTIASWNPAAEKMFGYTASEMIGQPITVLFPHDRLEEETKILASIGRGEAVEHLETVRLRKGGRPIEVSATISPIKDGDGKITGISKIVRDITESKEIEKQLRWKTAFLEAQVHSAFDAILIVDETGKTLLQNQRLADLWHIPQEIVDDADDRSRLEWVAGQLKNPQAFTEQVAYLYSHPDKISRDELEVIDGRHFERYSAPVRGRDGRHYGRIWVFRDITERKKSERELQKERDFTAAVVDTVGALVVVLDRQARIVSFNRACEQLSGYSFEEVAGREVIDLLVKFDQRAETRAEFGKLCAGQFPNTFENHWVARNGSQRLVAWSNTALLGSDGEVEYVIATGLDVTERKQSERKIAEQAALLDKARDAILVRDLQGNLLFWNQGAERMYGWKAEEVTGQDISKLLYSDPMKFEEVNALTIRNGEWQGELQHLTRTRKEITIEARWTLVRDDRGEPKSILAINTDVTEKKKIEAQFMRAQRMESIGTLAGGIAHDLNNILAPIMMSIEMLKETSSDPQAGEILETIEVSARRGADIVRQVLSFARGLESERVEIQARHLLRDLEKIIKDTFPKDIRLHFTSTPDTWTLLGDPTQLHQVLLNLCVNARDAMPYGGALSVGLENCELDAHYAAMNLQAKPGYYVKISVTDTGSGIPQELVDKIFEPFFTTKDLHKGTGLGLSTVMAIVKSHEGVINVYSELDKGTTFTVYLPALFGSTTCETEVEEQAHLPRGKGETILIVDDEASILAVTGQTLEAFGYRVLTAGDGAEAVATYAQHKHEIAIMLTDMMMPVMNGAATIQAVTRINPNVKIIAASGLKADTRAGQATNLGVKHFLAKPYTAGTLLQTVRLVLDES